MEDQCPREKRGMFGETEGKSVGGSCWWGKHRERKERKICRAWKRARRSEAARIGEMRMWPAEGGEKGASGVVEEGRAG